MSRHSSGGEGMSKARGTSGPGGRGGGKPSRGKAPGGKSSAGKSSAGKPSAGKSSAGKAPGGKGQRGAAPAGGRGAKAPASKPPRKGAGSAAGPQKSTGGRSSRRGGDPTAAAAARSGSPSSRGKGPRRSQSGGSSRSRAAKMGLGGDQVEGRHAVRELLLGGSRRVREILIIDDLDISEILDDISELAFEMKIPLKPMPRRRFETEALTQSHQGVLARAAVLEEHSMEDLANKKRAHLLVLDGVTDPGNLGAILRTAEVAGVTGVILGRHRAVHISPTVTKTAAGAIEHLPMAIVGGIPTAITKLNDLGILTVGLDMGGDTSIFDLPLEVDQPVALVLGAEGKGLSRLTRERVSVVASIPMKGQLNSLNVAMAGAIAMFEVVRRREA